MMRTLNLLWQVPGTILLVLMLLQFRRAMIRLTIRGILLVLVVPVALWVGIRDNRRAARAYADRSTLPTEDQ